MLARWCLPFRWSAARPDAGASQLWSRCQHFTPAQPLAVRRDVPPFRPSRPTAGRRTPCDRVLRLALVGFVLSILVLSLLDAAGSLEGEAIGPLRVVALESKASFVLSRAEEHPLVPAARLTAPPDERFTLHDYDWDDDDSLDKLLMVLTAHVLPLAAVRIMFDGSTHACLWPTYYLVRPQLLTRIEPLLVGRDIPSTPRRDSTYRDTVEI
jgi:hypothetical protein